MIKHHFIPQKAKTQVSWFMVDMNTSISVYEKWSGHLITSTCMVLYLQYLSLPLSETEPYMVTIAGTPIVVGKALSVHIPTPDQQLQHLGHLFSIWVPTICVNDRCQKQHFMSTKLLYIYLFTLKFTLGVVKMPSYLLTTINIHNDELSL